MAEYMHDEWCATNLDASPECDCVRKLLLDKDAQLATLEQRVEELEGKQGDLDNGHNMLDSLGAPKNDGTGITYSIVGRLAHWDLLQDALAQEEE